MKKLFENWNRFVLSESGLSRVHKWVTEHDCAIITAFRGDPSDKSNCVGASEEPIEELKRGKEHPLTKNRERNRNLKANLLDKGYYVTDVKGSYVEDYATEKALEVQENSFFVVNSEDDPGFKQEIAKLGRMYCQDSVLFIPKGGTMAYLYGTNKSDSPGLGKESPTGHFVGGKEGEFMSRVKGRPIVFTKESIEEGLETLKDHKGNSRMAIRLIAEEVRKQLSKLK
jgi:hypothetical protein